MFANTNADPPQFSGGDPQKKCFPNPIRIAHVSSVKKTELAPDDFRIGHVGQVPHNGQIFLKEIGIQPPKERGQQTRMKIKHAAEKNAFVFRGKTSELLAKGRLKSQCHKHIPCHRPHFGRSACMSGERRWKASRRLWKLSPPPLQLLTGNGQLQRDLLVDLAGQINI